MMAPAMAMKTALVAKMSTFVHTTLMPLWAAASSYSPMLCSARPYRERLIMIGHNSVKTTTANIA